MPYPHHFISNDAIVTMLKGEVLIEQRQKVFSYGKNFLYIIVSPQKKSLFLDRVIITYSLGPFRKPKGHL